MTLSEWVNRLERRRLIQRLFFRTGDVTLIQSYVRFQERSCGVTGTKTPICASFLPKDDKRIIRIRRCTTG